MEKNIKNLYIGLFACIILTSMPNTMLQNFAALFSIVFIIAAYILRKKLIADSFEHNHASFIIRTFWIWSSLLVIGMVIAGLIISKYGDMTAIDNLTNAAMNGEIPDEAAANRTAAEYFATNFQLILKTTILCLLPAQIYAGIKTFKGYSAFNKTEKIIK